MNVIITGCGRGIGAAAVRKFASRGWNIWACARRADKGYEDSLAALAETYGVWIRPVYFELTRETEIKAALQQIVKEKKEIDCLVNNAGAGCYELFQRIPVKQARELFEINFFAPYLIMQYVLRKMVRQKHGSVVNISSIASMYANQGESVYGASKAALNMLTKNLAAEYAAFGIRINAVAPGPIDTDMLKEHWTAKVHDAVYDRVALGRLGQADEIAETVFYLAGSGASFINGEIIRADGGRK